ncbi:dTMP kinase [Ketobacter sp. MCCC 1A13808]|uniref:dTMP kinase n=1 Tax=Ketobacter sp. MCCC 1A13808 TaxID=2602738 RepID=UPI000F29A8A4|nr:dTMP kinase [Ketobacter sp. MCCC 1A13808]MVF10681.1 dTMP kinase [Ketobacter sp. MCCC 1A13808]RLP56100.1 MAG: dTMP kinase [Ketobacter sp.]
MKNSEKLPKGRFITVEGSEGVGKTTNIEFIKHWLAENRIEFIVTREPGGTPLAEQLRELLLQPREESVDETAELLMVFAARAQHLNQVILPALRQGKWVLCDRFTDATYAYQGAGRSMNQDTIAQLENLVQNGLRPDAVILLDVSVEIGLQRARGRGELDRFEREDVAFFERVRAGYLARAANHSGYHVVDAGQPLDRVQQQLNLVLATLKADLT